MWNQTESSSLLAMTVVSRSAKLVLSMNSTKVEESACVAASLTMEIITFLQMFFHKFWIFFFVKSSFTIYDILFVYSSENVLDDVETKISKHQSTVATHISNTPQVCTI